MLSRKTQMTLIKKFIDKVSTLNQPITITDLIVTPIGYSKGEVDKEHPLQDAPTVTRLSDQIKILSQIANQYYRDLYTLKNADNSYQVKEDCSNKIFRLGTWEFAFYTSEPLTFDEFNQLIGSIESIAKESHENVFLLLSSVAVKQKDNRLFNMVIHVQCGKDPIIHITTKAFPHGVDPAYKYCKFNKFKHNEAQNGNYSASLLNPFPKEGIPYNPIIISKTLGGAELITMIDICFDHLNSYAKNSFEEVLKDAKKHINMGFFPSQLDYLLTSNVLDVIEDKRILGSTITRIDPKYVGIYHVKNNKYLPKIDMEEKKLDALIPGEYKKTQVVQQNGDTIIKNPPFGVCSYKITAYPERQAEQFDKTFLSKINQINKTISVNSAKELLRMKSTKLLSKLYTTAKKELKNADESSGQLKRKVEELEHETNPRSSKRRRV